MNPITTTLSILLAVSMAGNAFFGRAYLTQRDKTVEAVTEEKNAVGVALGCSKSVEQLETKAVERHEAAVPKIKAAQQQAQQHNREADRILTTPPAVPGNACASAQAVVDEWWQGRAKP